MFFFQNLLQEILKDDIENYDETIKNVLYAYMQDTFSLSFLNNQSSAVLSEIGTNIFLRI